MSWLENWAANAVTLLFVVNFIIALTIIFLERKNPSATLAWICILFLLPGFGIICYAMLSQNISRQRIFNLSGNEEYFARKALKNQIDEMSNGEYVYSNHEEYVWRDMIRLHQTYAGAYYTQDNKMDIITDGSALMERLFEDIENATDSINIQFFIIKNDEVGRKLIRILEKKAEQGVEVRLLIDAVGGRQIWRRSLRKFMEAGGKYAFFFESRFRVINMKLNYRNHRKLTIIDGEIGYIGGFNIGREYLGKKRKFGYWRDTHLRFMGNCVRDINSRFLLDWREASKEDIILSSVYYAPVAQEGNTGVQIVSCGPESSKQEIKRGYMKMITSARKNVYIQTPYFVPDQSILESLKMAAQSGVDVRIMIPCMPDHMFVYWATYAYVGELIHSGCRVFIYDHGFLHAKTLVADGEVVSCGSANFDRRSFALNFEANAFIYDSAEAYKMEAIFEADMTKCHELTRRLYDSRSSFVKFKESISRLMSDLL